MNAAPPKISVVVPVFNAEKYLRESLDSVLGQSLREIEVICVNDGSTDSSGEILRETASRDARVRVISQPKRGVGAARNAGMLAAKGEFLAFVDSDDLLPDANTYETLFSCAREHCVKICGGSVEILHDNGRCRRPPETDELVFGADALLNFSDFQEDYGFYRYIFERELLLEKKIFFPTYVRYQDPPFLARALDAAGTFFALRRASYVYRFGQREIDWNFRRVCDELRGVRDNLKFSREHGYAKLHYRQISRFFAHFRPHILPLVRAVIRAGGTLDVPVGNDGDLSGKSNIPAPVVALDAAAPELLDVLREINALIDLRLAREFKNDVPDYSVATDIFGTADSIPAYLLCRAKDWRRRFLRLKIRRERIALKFGKFEAEIPLFERRRDE